VEPNGIAKQEPPGSHWWFDPKVEESKKCKKERMGQADTEEYQRKERAVVGFEEGEEWKVRDSR
jgi:hypothetical protein